MPIVDAGLIKTSRVPPPFERELKVVMSPETHPGEVTDFTLLFATLAPNGGCTDFHTHESAGELMVITSGNGKAWLAGVEHELKPGIAMYAPPGMEHKTMNTGGTPLNIVCVFVPPASADYINAQINAAETG
jgi:mannose-6-phosphate isomerase-like protein (cupin superfamily)